MSERNNRYDDDDRGRRRSRDDDDDDRGRRRSSRDDDDDRGSSRGRSRDYQYEERSADTVRKRASQGARDFDKFLKDEIKGFKVPDDDVSIRILPPTWKKAQHYGVDLYVHYGIGPDRQSYLCPHKHNGDPCPICEEREKALADGDEDYAKKLEPKRRVLVYLVDRDAEKDGVVAWAMPWTVDKDIGKISEDKRTGEVLRVDHPEDGYDISFSKTGKADRTKYEGVAIARRSSPLGNDKWLDFAIDHPLPDQLVFFDYDHIAKAFGGGGAHRSKRDHDDDDDRSSRRRSRDDDSDRDDSRSRGRSRDDDDRGSRRSRDDEDDDHGSRSRRSRDEPELSWENVHEMTRAEMRDLVESKDLDVNVRKAEDDDELADMICEALKIEKPGKRRSRDDDNDGDRGGRGREKDDDERLSNMRRRREE